MWRALPNSFSAMTLRGTAECWEAQSFVPVMNATNDAGVGNKDPNGQTPRRPIKIFNDEQGRERLEIGNGSKTCK